jgi:two-component sensor histidine kinase
MKDMAEGIEDRDRNLREAVAQKTLQIRETHHRVKNNLQVVMSLLSLQAAQSGVPEVRDALTQAQARINALALVHRNLNQIEDQTSVDLQDLLGELTRQIVDSMVVDHAKISVTVDILPVRVTGEIAVPIALFTVEALVNIFKHAFPSKRPTGSVSIGLGRRNDGVFCLAIEDNGIGFSAADFKPGIGERLLKVFGRQVRGTVSMDSRPDRGTRVELTFSAAGSTIERPIEPVSATI